MTTLPLAPATNNYLWTILATVSRVCSVSTDDILSDSRYGHVVLARQMVCYVARERGMKCTDVARFVGRDHTTVLAAVARIAKRRVARPDVEEMVRQVDRVLDETEPPAPETPAPEPAPPEPAPAMATFSLDRIPVHPTYLIEFEDVVRTGNHEVYMRRMLKEALRKYGFKARSVKSLTPPAEQEVA